MKQRLRLLIVESSNADLASLLHALDSQGFDVTLTVISTASVMRAALGSAGVGPDPLRSAHR